MTSSRQPRAASALASITGAELLSKLRASGAKATLVNVWASWCGSCKHELPMLQGLASSLEALGVRVVLVSVDEPENSSKAAAFLVDNGIRIPSYLAARPLGAFKAAMNPAWPGMLPASFLFDASGKLRYFWGGEAFENELVPVIEDLLSGKPVNGAAPLSVAPGRTEPN